jgi:hypothetical protein
MFVSRSKTLIAALTAATLIAGCGGTDTASRQRNAALPGAQQCLSDEGTTIDSSGLVQLDFCAEAASFEIWQGDIRVAEPIAINTDSMNTFQAPAGEHTFRVVSMSANGEQVGEDVVNTITDSCSTGGACEIGDIGPGGGIVAYDAGEKKDWGQYIEIARKGWYDNTIGPNASEDPKGAMNCLPNWVGTENKLGAGKNNTEMMILSCRERDRENLDSYSLVEDYNSRLGSPKQDWVIPTPTDLLEIELSYKAINDLQVNELLATSSEVDDQRWVWVYQFGRTKPEPCPLGCQSTVKSNAYPVRPVRYFASDGPVTPTVKVTGIMATPTTPDTTVVASSNGSPTDLKFESGEQLKLTWKSEGNTDGQEFLVEFRGDNNNEFIAKRVPCCEYSFTFDQFEANVSYTFVVSLANDIGERISTMRISFIPILKLFDADGGSISNPSEENTSPPDASVAPEKESSTTVEQAKSPSSGEVDCTVAPSVKFPLNPTTDDTVSFVVFHPCFGKDRNQQVYYGRVVTDADGKKSRPVDASQSFRGTSYHVQARFEEGTHTFDFSAGFRINRERVFTEAKQISFEVTKGDESNDNVCDINRISLVGKALLLNCPVVSKGRLSAPSISSDVQVKTSGDEWVADLSGLPDGWHYLAIMGNYGLESFLKEVSVCITQCDASTTFAPIEVQQDNDTLTASMSCSGVIQVVQMYKVSDQIYVQSSKKRGTLTGNIDISLHPSTTALQFVRSCSEEGDQSLFTFGLLNRSTSPSATPPTAEDIANDFNESVATISLPEITQGASDLPVGPVSGGSFAVAAQAESLSLTPDVVFELLDLTIAGSKVEQVEISADGKRWVPGNFGDIALPEDASQLSIRLTAEDGSQTVITRDIERTSSSTPAVGTASESGMGAMNLVFIALALLLLLAAAFALKKKRAT